MQNLRRCLGTLAKEYRTTVVPSPHSPLAGGGESRAASTLHPFPLPSSAPRPFTASKWNAESYRLRFTSTPLCGHQNLRTLHRGVVVDYDAKNVRTTDNSVAIAQKRSLSRQKNTNSYDSTPFSRTAAHSRASLLKNSVLPGYHPIVFTRAFSIWKGERTREDDSRTGRVDHTKEDYRVISRKFT